MGLQIRYNRLNTLGDLGIYIPIQIRETARLLLRLFDGCYQIR